MGEEIPRRVGTDAALDERESPAPAVEVLSLSREELARMAQRLVEKNKVLESIIDVASHDLRSPLVNIQGFSKELARSCREIRSRLSQPEFEALRAAGLADVLTADIPESVRFIQSSVAKMDALLAGILRFMRLGRASMAIERLDMNRMLADIAQSMEFQLQEGGVSLQIHRLPDCLGDAVQINQLFSNLLDNALKYRAPGRPGRITVSDRGEEGRAVYVVEDNGIGIDPGHHARIFEIFHRLNPDLSEGEGLGLTIALRILERHDGMIWLESEPGIGSSFFVSLPSPAPGCESA